jgi:methionine synthase / methylenetetrahydrofolate reductase(NADPH)
MLSYMAADFLHPDQAIPVLCDGAMGTLLYAKGIFINRCYDELNLSQPDLIRGIHHEYLQAGAEIIETNTFGGTLSAWAGTAWPTRSATSTGWARGWHAKPPRASMCGWRDRLARWEPESSPWAKLRLRKPVRPFASRLKALVEGGVDLLILETFGYLEELHQAMLAAKDVGANLPIVVQVTIDEDGNCLDGSDPETFVALEEWGADVIGCNCSVGPVAMLDAMERVRAATSLPLAAQPNAGIPRSVEGRNIYLCSPEYMASYARKFVAAGVRMVGGCCGTTPEHIRVMKSALRVGEAAGRRRRRRPRAGAAPLAGNPGACRWRTVPSGREAGPRRVRHHGRDRSSQGIDIRKESRARVF